MKRHDDDVWKIEEALIHSHRKPVEFEAGPFWQQTLMARVLVESTAEHGNGLGYSRTVWRAAFVTCLLALLLATYVLESDLGVQYQMAELFLDDADGLDLASSFGIL